MRLLMADRLPVGSGAVPSQLPCAENLMLPFWKKTPTKLAASATKKRGSICVIPKAMSRFRSP